jgi:hypothetical protein
MAVSRHGPRSIETTLKPASVMDLATIEPVQPNPMVTTSVGGSFVAIAPFLLGDTFPRAGVIFVSVHQC